MTKPSASLIAGCITWSRVIVPLSCRARAIASTMAGMVPPMGPLPGMMPRLAKRSGVASAGAVPCPLMTDIFLAPLS